MGNGTSSATSIHTSNKRRTVKSERNYMFEPLVEHEDEVQARIAEAFHFPSSSKKQDPDDMKSLNKDNDPANNSASKADLEEGSIENGLAKAHETKLIRRKSSAKKIDGAAVLLDTFPNMKREDGWVVVLHSLSLDDTLAGLSLRYNVSTDVIRRANFMSDDRLVSYVRLLIPTKNLEALPEDTESIDDQVTAEIQKAFDTPIHRRRLVQLLTQMDSSKLGAFAAEYYLERNEFNFRNALKEAESDTDWERSHRVARVADWKSPSVSNAPSIDLLSG